MSSDVKSFEEITENLESDNGINDLVANLKDLCEALEEHKEPVSSCLNVEAIDEKFRDLFDPEAFKKLETRFKTTVWPMPERKTVYLSAIAKSEEGIKKAAKEIADEVNLIALSGQLLGCLQPLSIIKLAGRWMKDDKVCGFRDGRGKDHFEMTNIVKGLLEGKLEAEKPKGAVWVEGDTGVFCFVTVPWIFEPNYIYGNNSELYVAEGQVSETIYE
jgi:hypothetical protein